MNRRVLTVLLACLLMSPMTFADEQVSSEAEAQEASIDTSHIAKLKEQYSLSDEQIEKLEKSGLPKPQLSMVAALAKESGKSIDEILKMRTEQKMGWGKIAKELNVSPKLIGQSVSSMHRQDDPEKRKERHEAREERKQKREEKRQARKEERAEKRENKKH